ncbi:hypothetical protein EI555_019974, partial [Monodon monoceros]
PWLTAEARGGASERRPQPRGLRRPTPLTRCHCPRPASTLARSRILLTDKEKGQLPPDEVLDEAVPEYRAPGRKSLLEIQQLDPDDESLVNYKRVLLGPEPPAVDPSLPNVQVTSLTLMSEQAPGPITMDLTGELAALKNRVFVLKEGVDYKVKITFKVNKEIVSGLKCLHHTYRQGLRVDKAVYMVGSYGPSAQEYEFVTPLEEAPRGVLVRGAYVVTSFFTDDDRTPHLSWDLSSLQPGLCATGRQLLGPHPLLCPGPVGPGTAMDGQLLPVLLLLLGASGLWGQGPGPEGPLEEPPEEEPPEEEPPEEDGILVLSRQTLGLALREHPALLALAPEYSKAAALLAAESAKVRLAKVDGPAEPELAEEFAVTKYPTLKFFLDGNHRHPEEYTGPWEAEGIAEWLRRRVGPSATRLEDEEGAQALIDARDVVVIGFFQDLQDKDVATFLALAQDALDMSFGLTNQPQLFQKFGLTKDTVVLFKKYDEGRADFPVDEELGLDQGDLSCFLLTHSMHLVTEFNSQTSRKIFAARILNHLLLFVNQTLASHRELLAGFREAAPSFRGQVLFVVVDLGASNDHVLQYFGLKAEEAPTLRFINIETTKKYMPADRGPVTATSVAAFCHAVLGGEVKVCCWTAQLGGGSGSSGSWERPPNKAPGRFSQPYRLSQEVPPRLGPAASQDPRGQEFRADAPWCTHCKEMAPAWEALAEKYRDHEDIVIAELDATANELEALPVHSFPTLTYFPAGPGRKVIEYKGTRDLDTFSKLLDSGGELPAEEPTEVPGAPFPEMPENTTEPKDEL